MKLFIKNMVCTRCIITVTELLESLGLAHAPVELGSVDIAHPMSASQCEQFTKGLTGSGLELMNNKKNMLIEQIKNVIVQLVHYTDARLKTNFSVFLSDSLGYDYTYLANIFSAHQRTTIEKFLISHKIERAKELLAYDELNLTEIAQKLHYSSVGHLSNQFKKITGSTPSSFRRSRGSRLNLENM
jgi:AraC-like DNA-binding protein